ncbi:MAG: hypothetical protein R6U93_04755 [Dehalococcoidia bacterium]
MYKDGALYRAMVDGILAQRILDGDPTAHGPKDPEVLKALVAQGKRVEERCRQLGKLETIERAKQNAERR